MLVAPSELDRHTSPLWRLYSCLGRQTINKQNKPKAIRWLHIVRMAMRTSRLKEAMWIKGGRCLSEACTIFGRGNPKHKVY